MAESRSKDNWNHTSAVLALIINVNRDPKRHGAVSPKELNPHEKKAKTVLKGEDLRILKDVFVNRRPLNEL